MTGIAAVAVDGTVFMGGDSAAVEDNHYLTMAATPKVFEVGPLVMGYTSSFRMGYALQHRLKLPDGLPGAHDLAALDRWMAVDFIDAVRQVMRDAGYMKREYEREQGGCFLVGVRGHLYYLDDDFHARRELLPYAAVGSGLSVILGALFIATRIAERQPWSPEHMVTHALEAAQAFTTTVRAPFHVIVGGRA